MFDLKVETSGRIRRAQAAIRAADLDLLFIVGRENLIYFTGSTQLECMALIIPKEGQASAVTLWLDVEYFKANTGIPNIKGYVFPTQDLVTKAVEVLKEYGLTKPRIGFEKYFVEFAVYDGLRRAFPEENFVNASELIYRLRAVKSLYEVEMITMASQIVVQGMAAAIKAVKPGVSELEVLAEAEYAMLKAGSGGSSFRMQVVSGERALLTHPCASNKKLGAGEAIVIHLGATYEGYCAKMCRTAAIDSLSEGQQRTFYLLKEAQEKALEILKPGVRAWQVDAAVREVLQREGYANNYPDIIGYGVGLRQSEFYPIIGKNRQDVIEDHMIVDLLLATIYRKEMGGPRLTDMIQVTPEGPHILTDFLRELIIV